jgi:hypothetical protein
MNAQKELILARRETVTHVPPDVKSVNKLITVTNVSLTTSWRTVSVLTLVIREKLKSKMNVSHVPPLDVLCASPSIPQSVRNVIRINFSRRSITQMEL